WGVIIKEAVANGRLTPHGHGKEKDTLARIAANHDVGVDAVALAAVLANPWAGVVLSGAVTPAQLQSNIAATQLQLDPAELEELTTLAEPAGQYWRERATLPWD
ncbi:MAG: aldo/keto reductase, partial [Actinomycetes bacterium]